MGRPASHAVSVRDPTLNRMRCSGLRVPTRNVHCVQALIVAPLYVLAGLVRLPGSVFATWALLETLLWTPALVLLTATAGDAFVARMSPVLGSGVTTVTAAAVMVLLLHGIRLNTRSGGMC